MSLKWWVAMAVVVAFGAASALWFEQVSEVIWLLAEWIMDLFGPGDPG